MNLTLTYPGGTVEFRGLDDRNPELVAALFTVKKSGDLHRGLLAILAGLEKTGPVENVYVTT